MFKYDLKKHLDVGLYLLSAKWSLDLKKTALYSVRALWNVSYLRTNLMYEFIRL